MRAELDVYNDEGEHVLVSFNFETDNQTFVDLVVKDTFAAIRSRSKQWDDAHVVMLFLAEDEPLPGEENDYETEEDNDEME